MRYNHAPQSEKARSRYLRVKKWIARQGQFREVFSPNAGDILTPEEIERVAKVLARLRVHNV
jgi:hypothetical protein